MKQFAYTAIETSTGKECHGSITSTNREQAAADLKLRGFAPVSLEAYPGASRVTPSTVADPAKNAAPAEMSGRAAKGRTIVIGRVFSPAALAQLFRQLATLMKAGVPLLRALEVLRRQERSEARKSVLNALAEVIRSGGTFSDGLQQHPGIFDRLQVSMVKAGEMGGALDSVLDRLARFLERSERIKGRVKAAMTYPLIVLVVAAAILGALMVFVVPKFAQIFSGLLRGQPLPAATQFVIGISSFLRDHFLALLGLGLLLWVTLAAVRRTRAGRRVLDRLLLKTPVLGDLVLKAAIARFTRTLGSLLASGAPILQALAIARDTSGNVLVAEAITTVHDRVKAGESVAAPLESAAIFPGMVTSMIEVGEETGSLSEMLGRIADAYDEEVDNAVSALTALIEPVMIVVMAVVVGTIVIALFLPIVSIIQHLQ